MSSFRNILLRISGQGRAVVLFESLLDQSRSTWLFVTTILTKKNISIYTYIGTFGFILRSFSRSASNLYATDVLLIKGNEFTFH